MRLESIRGAVALLAAAALIPACGGGPSSSPAPTPSSSTSAHPSVSRDGRIVVFDTASPAQVVVVDRATGGTVVLLAGAGEILSNAVLTPDGRFVAFESRPAPGGNSQILLRDLTTGTTTLVSAGPDGQPGNGDSTSPSISDDGRFVAFQSTAPSLGARSASSHSVLVRDVSSASTQSASSSATGDDIEPSISGNGQFVAFESRPLRGGFSSVLRLNRENGQLTSVSESAAGTPTDGDSAAPSISGDGRIVAFESRATTLAPPGVPATAFKGQSNVFVRDALTGALVLASESITPGVPTNGDSRRPSLSEDGRRVAFESTAANLTSDQIPSGESNVFVHDLPTGTTTLLPPLATTTPVPPSSSTAPPATIVPQGFPGVPSTTPATTPTARPTRPTPTATAAPTGTTTGPATTPTATPTPPTPTATVAPTGTTTGPATPGVPTGNAAGVGTGTPIAPTGSATGLGTGTPIAPTGNAAGLGTGMPIVPTGNAAGLGTGTPVVPTGNASGLGTGTPVVPTGNASGLGTGTAVSPTGNAGGLGTGTPVVSTGNGAPLGTGTPVVSTGTGTSGTQTPVVATGITIAVAATATAGARPSISADGGWVVFESSRAGILVAELATGQVSGLR